MLWCCLAPAAWADLLQPGFSETTIGLPWDAAVGLTFDSNGRLFVWEKAGRVWVVEDGQRAAEPFLDLSEEVGNWRDHGLLGFALSPGFLSNGYVYAFYVVDRHHLDHCAEAPTGGVAQCGPGYSASEDDYLRSTIARVTRYRARMPATGGGYAQSASAEPTSRKVLIGETTATGIPIVSDSHGAGSLIFGVDGSLLVTTGDGAHSRGFDGGSETTTFGYGADALQSGVIRPAEDVGAFRSQLVDSLSGKVLRIDPATGAGIEGNPFFDAAAPRAPRSRVWALGLRNPFRATLIPDSGSHQITQANPGILLVGDVGHNAWESLRRVRRGDNAGWPIYEGMTAYPRYRDQPIANLDAPNPLAATAGCVRPHFHFQDLLGAPSEVGIASLPNPCDLTRAISTAPTFLHARPLLDWGRTANGPARAAVFVNGEPQTVDLGSSGSPLSGASFRGNSVTGGAWYQGSLYPSSYRNSYFFADFAEGWIRTLHFDSAGNALGVEPFAENLGGVVAMAVDPVEGALHYISYATVLRRVGYAAAGNQIPTARIEFDRDSAPDQNPLRVLLDGSSSFDPEGGALSYRWDLGDGSAPASERVVDHEFAAATDAPETFTVTLTVTDAQGAMSAPATRQVYVNNSAPQITISEPAATFRYPLDRPITYRLAANIEDSEHSFSELECRWVTALHHNNHKHDEPADTACDTTVTISPLGCDGNLYYYRHTLTVTDAAGLSAQQQVSVYPDCAGAPPTLAIAPATALEGSGVLTVALQLDRPASAPVRLGYETLDGTAMAGPDYERTSGTLRFEAGEQLLTVAIPLVDDALPEGAESFQLRLFDLEGAEVANPGAPLTIEDDDVPVSFPCGAPPINFARSNGTYLWPDCDVDERWHLRVGRGGIGSLQIFSGILKTASATSTAVPYRLEANDQLIQPDVDTVEYIFRTWGGDQDGFSVDQPVCFETAQQPVYLGRERQRYTDTTLDLRTGRRCAAGPPGLSIAQVSVAEGSGAARFVGRLDAAVSVPMRLAYETVDGSAAAGEDYRSTSGTLTVPAGELEFHIEVPLLDDELVEPLESFSLSVASVSQTPVSPPSLQVVAEIRDDDGVACGPPRPAVQPGIERGLFLYRDCIAQRWHLLATPGGQFGLFEGRFTSDAGFPDVVPVGIESTDTLFASGTGLSFALRVTGRFSDAFTFADQTPLCFQSAGGAASTVLVGPDRSPQTPPFALPDLGPCSSAEPVLSVDAVAVSEGAGTALIPVTLAGSRADRAVSFGYRTLDGSALGGSDYVAGIGTGSLGAGESATQVSVTILDDSLTEGGEYLEVELFDIDGARAGNTRARVELLDDDGVSCGPPTNPLQPGTERGVVLYHDCTTGVWQATFSGGGRYALYRGSLSSDRGIASLTGIGIEDDDVLSLAGAAAQWSLRVVRSFTDGFTFDINSGASACFAVDLPPDATLWLGPQRQAVTPPIDLQTLEPCL
ncbi:MAG: Calx-beta domain-containing protein [Pseudomonadota bacterium]